MDPLLLSAMIIVACGLGGAVAGAAYLFIGGTGVARMLSNRITALEQQADSIDGRLSREVKRRAAQAATDSKHEAKSMKELADEAQLRLAIDNPPTAPVEGFPSMFTPRG